MQVFYDKLVPSTADHRSSTLQDLNAGKKTEIDALTGAVLRLAKQKGVDVPFSTLLYRLIRFIESQGGRSSGAPG